jgi:hypothetical protein
MAGFVMRDPRLNKYGMTKADFNRRKHHEALVADEENQGWLADTTPLKITVDRIAWLKKHEYITVAQHGDRMDGVATHPTGISFRYSLIREQGDLYGVYFDNTDPNRRWVQEKGGTVVRYHRKYGASYEPMLAMTNPPGHRQFHEEHYKNAITGDYDLFAIWPFAAGYDPGAYGLDHRPLGTVRGSNSPQERANVDQLERNFTTQGQGTKLGNITPRIYLVCQLINSIVGRHVLWHSDEAARPFLDDVDLPVMAFAPSGAFLGVDTIDDFKLLIVACETEGIRVSLSNAWAQDPTQRHPDRLGAAYAGYVPSDGQRIIVPAWYNA